jgi:hypothetical protein
MVNGVWSTILVILACTLAGGRDFTSLQEEEEDTPTATCSNTSNSQPCSGLAKKIEVWHIVTPIYIAGAAWLIVAMPTLFLAGRHKARGIRDLLCTLALLWIHLIISYCIFYFLEDIVLAYTWGVHSSAHALATWKPRRFVLICQAIQPWVAVLGVLCVAGFAKEVGAPVSLIPWQNGRQAQCGLRVHLLSIIGVDFVDWIVGPVREMMVC